MSRASRLYTRAGDDGTTSLVGGRKVPKSHPRVTAYGAVDELNASLGVALVSLERGRGEAIERIKAIVSDVQLRLFVLGTELACAPEDFTSAITLIADEDIDALEREIDALDAGLPPLRAFVLPGGGEAGAALHLSRTVCRRAEISVLALHEVSPVREDARRYMNRLSDYLFVAARASAHAMGFEEKTFKGR